jgi:hypothetical protein
MKHLVLALVAIAITGCNNGKSLDSQVERCMLDLVNAEIATYAAAIKTYEEQQLAYQASVKEAQEMEERDGRLHSTLGMPLEPVRKLDVVIAADARMPCLNAAGGG